MQELRWPTYALRDLVLDAAVPDERGSLRVRDDHGREYLDAVNGIGCAPLGHGHPRWVAAMHAQMVRLGAAANSFATAPQQRFAAEIAARMPVPDARVFLASSGTETTEAAIKLAMRATGRSVVVAFERAFHGRSLGALACTANKAYRHPYVRCIGEVTPEDPFAVARVLRVPFGDLGALAGAFAEHGRSIAAQMHADFGALRRAMPLNIGARLHGRGHTPEALHDLARIVALWTECRQRWRHLGPLLLGEFSIADAMYAPVVLRCETYGVELPPVAAAYADAVRALPAVVAWCEDARRETAFVAHDEPYRSAPERGSG